MKKMLLIAALFSVGGAFGMATDVDVTPMASSDLTSVPSEQTQSLAAESVLPEVTPAKNMFGQVQECFANFPKQAQERFASLTNQAKEGFTNVTNKVGKKELVYVGAAVATVAVATLAYKLYKRKTTPKKASK